MHVPAPYPCISHEPFETWKEPEPPPLTGCLISSTTKGIFSLGWRIWRHLLGIVDVASSSNNNLWEWKDVQLCPLNCRTKSVGLVLTLLILSIISGCTEEVPWLTGLWLFRSVIQHLGGQEGNERKKVWPGLTLNQLPRENTKPPMAPSPVLPPLRKKHKLMPRWSVLPF